MSGLSNLFINHMWRRLLGVGICFMLIGGYLIYTNVSYESEKAKPLETLSYNELADNMQLRGEISFVVGKYTANLGKGENTYYIAALPSTVGSDAVKYICVCPGEQQNGMLIRLWDTLVEECQAHLESGSELPDISAPVVCKLHKISDNFLLTNAYWACGGYVPQGDILPYYTESTLSDYRTWVTNAPEYPIGWGIGILGVGAAMTAVWIIHYIKGKNSY